MANKEWMNEWDTKSDPFCGGGMDFFWNHTIEIGSFHMIISIA